MTLTALTLQNIIDQADILVPNSESTTNKAVWLNEINQKFFEIVKIPKSSTFTTTLNTATITGLNAAIRGRNIDKVYVGKSLFPSFQYEDVPPGHNYHTFDDDTATLTLSPTPTATGLTGILRWLLTATSTYTSSTLSSSPDAPTEYHFVYIPGLAYKIAETLEDIVKKNNYEKSFMDNLNIAQQNFAKLR